MPANPERTALYRLFDTDDRLLYVGISSEPKARMRDHAAEKSWWGDVATRDFEWFDSRQEAAEAEIEAIRNEQPLHNHAHNTSAVLALLPAARTEPLRPQFTPVAKDGRSVAQRMAADIRPLIMSGDMPAGTRLPSTRDLCAQYQTSNVTVQRGLRILKEEGFAVGRNGSAVYVTSPAPEHLGDPEHEIFEQISNDERFPPRSVARALGASDREVVRRQEQVLRVDDRPVRIVTTYRRLAGEVESPVEVVDQVTVRPPTSTEVLALQISQEVPVMVTLRRTLDEHGGVLNVQTLVEPGNLCLRLYRTPIVPQ
ncbi:GntR family transcriptional regulator [Streptomyces sp. NEAU-sy36]|uniref:GntR family transcriptional regulator n=1 Tax=unclassified Streptomyces TaxID=2593676 RepID=UPI0015D643FC|nr:MULTISPECIES: GntR family transcriptional regulator [unclassified Streptomyces]QLJ01510.1 GntR family transcriptional regulator [Streptomyces sp. NEAU-sy36]